MPQRKEIVWSNIKESNTLILKENETINVKFLDNGYIEEHEIIDDTTNEAKEIDKYIFEVKDLDDNKKKELSFIQNRAIVKLKAFNPLKDKSFSIRKFSFGNGKFDPHTLLTCPRHF